MAPPTTIHDFGGKEKNNKNVIPRIDRSQHEISPEAVVYDPTTLKDKQFLHSHNAIVHNTTVQSWICDVCEKSFKSKLSLTNHAKNVHQTASARFECTQCSKSLEKEYLLDQHIRRVHSNRLFECDCCGKGFNDRKVFAIHFQTQHQQTHEVQCPKCDQTLLDRQAYLQHKFQSHRDMKFVCDQCGHVCRLKNSLAQHSEVHCNYQGSPYNCSECSAKFRTISYRRKHMSSVHKDKRFHCDCCRLQFGTKSCLAQHVNAVHLKLRPFKCPECLLSFPQRGSVNLHIARRHKNQNHAM